MNYKTARELAGLSQFATAQKAGIPRMRLSLCECGQIELQQKDEAALRQVLRRALEQRAVALEKALCACAAAKGGEDGHSPS